MKLRVIAQVLFLFLLSGCAVQVAPTLTEIERYPFYKPPIKTVVDLRAMIQTQQSSIMEGMKKAGTPEVFGALMQQFPHARISIVEYQPGQTFRWILYRSNEDGEVKAVMNSTWDGNTPLKSYEFFIDSNDKRYIFTVPHSSGNLALKEVVRIVVKTVPGPERIVEKIVEVPGPQRIVEVPGPERIVEKIVEVPVPAEYSSRIVEKLVEKKDISLEYNVKSKVEDNFICLDFSILENYYCEGDQCLSEEVVNEVKELVENDDNMLVYPLFDRDTFRIPKTRELNKTTQEFRKFCNSPIPYTESQGDYWTTLKKCDDSIEGYACTNDKVFLEYIGREEDNKDIYFNFLLFNKNNHFIDAININLSINIYGGKITVNDIKYNKMANVSTVRENKSLKYTIIVLDDGRKMIYAVMNKKDNNKIEFISWDGKSEKIKTIFESNLDHVFLNKDNFTDFSFQLKNSIYDKYIVENNIFADILCNEIPSKSIEVVYPDRKKSNIRPIPIEYLPLTTGDKKIVGDCYIVSHRPTIGYPPGGKIDRIDIFMDNESKHADEVVINVAKKFEEYLADTGTIDQLTIWEEKCPPLAGGDLDCSSSAKQLKMSPQQPYEVYWHKKIPDREKASFPNSLLIFIGHYGEGAFHFNKERTFNFNGSLGRMTSPNYLLNVCGKPASASFDKNISAEFNNLIYAYKEISSQEAATSTFCAVDRYMAIPRGQENCISMSRWMREVRTCMKERLQSEVPSDLAFHLVGNMEEKVCRN
ncbi:MAG: hypothetical protein Q3M30_19440 [Candidatus Electrothrix sp. Rat3]|nr:hypothetical protein [Candidatus Electrothrix rattekaaiensis]